MYISPKSVFTAENRVLFPYHQTISKLPPKWTSGADSVIIRAIECKKRYSKYRAGLQFAF